MKKIYEQPNLRLYSLICINILQASPETDGATVDPFSDKWGR